MSEWRTPAGAMPAIGHDAEAAVRVLIAEDETHLGAILEQFLTTRGFAVRVVRDGRSALEALLHDAFDVALLDVVMPEVDGLEVLRQVREQPVPPEIIVITGNGTIETAMAALKLGAYDFLSKPYRMAEIEALVRRAWEKRLLVRGQRYRQELDRREEPPAMTTAYAPLRAVLDMVEKFIPSPLPVLITGEAGSGRSRLARRLHHGRPAGSFVRVPCPALGEAQQLRVLFGDGAGANGEIAGDDAPALGALELASSGTLYLHDVDALGREAQRRLLAVLDEGVLVTTDHARRLPVTARVVASSTRELASLVANGDFDEQLLHRLSAMRVQLPPLRERGSDAVILARQFLVGAQPGRRLAFTQAALEAIEAYPWPGNVRELRAAVQRAVYLTSDGLVTPQALGLGGGTLENREAIAGPATGPSVAPPAGDARAGSLAELERRHIAAVLEQESWHQGRAAERLGISPKTLYRKIREYGFKRPSGRNA